MAQKNGKAKTICRASSFTIIIKAGSLYPLSFRSSRIVCVRREPT